MPFIEKSRRDVIDLYGLQGLAEVHSGDRCYVYYRNMVEDWNANPRWTTVHNMFKDATSKLIVDDDDDVARALAWQVFFNIHVMHYEQMKRNENGDII